MNNVNLEKEIYEVINWYYPSNLEAFDPLYEQSEQFARLESAVLLNIKDNGAKIRDLSEQLRQIFPDRDYILQDKTLFNYLDRCITLEIEDKKQIGERNRYSLHVCFNILGDYCCVYRKCTEVIRDLDGEYLGSVIDKDYAVDLSFPKTLLVDLTRKMGDLGYKCIEEELLRKKLPQYTFFGVPKEKFSVFTGLFKDIML